MVALETCKGKASRKTCRLSQQVPQVLGRSHGVPAGICTVHEQFQLLVFALHASDDAVVVSPAADEDLVLLFEFLLDRAQTLEDIDHSGTAVAAIRSAVLHQLAATPYSFRKAGKSRTRLELIVPFGATG
jgi:hypothetical protein